MLSTGLPGEALAYEELDDEEIEDAFDEEDDERTTSARIVILRTSPKRDDVRP